MKKKELTDKKLIDNARIANYMYNKKLDPLQDKYPHWKGRWSDNKEKRPEVKEILLPFIKNFINERCKWNKLPKMYCNDARTVITQHFIGRYYPSLVYINGKNVKKKVWYKPISACKNIIDTIKEEIQGFTESEILDMLICVMYKNRIDHYSLKLKPFVNTKPDERAVSMWDKISENVQV